ncbi:MAG: YciI family protein [Cyanobacteria bacterium P01_E01_bin.34]
MPWFVKIECGIVDKSRFDLHVPAHLAYVRDLVAQGHKAQTGYWQESEGGMLLFKAETWAEAEAIVSADPLIVAGCVDYELHQWVKVEIRE